MSYRSKNRSQTESLRFPLKKLDVQDFFLPQLSKKKVVHSKNPFKVKPQCFPDEALRKKKTLTGLLFLELTHTELPHEIIKADLSNQNITEINPEDLKYFVNLEDLDLSENPIGLEALLNLPALRILKLRSSLLTSLQLPSSNPFQTLQTLDLAFNRLSFDQIPHIFKLPQIKALNLSGNELNELPVGTAQFRALEDLDLSYNLFSSEHKAPENWLALAVIPNLRVLNLSRNFLRGIHTEKLVAGHFNTLEKLDFSFNIVENQHNLISARNFLSLRVLDVTGNPFAANKTHKGLEMEVYAKTGAELINLELGKPYLKKASSKQKRSIRFPNMVRLQEQILRRDNKTYFFGVQLPGFNQTNGEEIVEKEVGNTNEEQGLDERSDDEEKFQRFFITEEQNIEKEEKKAKNLEKKEEKRAEVFEIKEENPVLERKTKPKIPEDYQEFKKAAAQIVGDSKDYENPINLTSAYKILRNIMKKPNSIEFEDFMEPHFMKPTSVIQKFKFNDEAKELEKMASEYLKGKLEKADNSEMGNVEKILDDLNRKMKKR